MRDLHAFLRGLSWIAVAIAAVFFLVLVVLFWITGAEVLWQPSAILLVAALLLRGLSRLVRPLASSVGAAVGESQASQEHQAS